MCHWSGLRAFLFIGLLRRSTPLSAPQMAGRAGITSISRS